MALPVIERERITAETLPKWQRHHCPPKEPGFTPDRVQPDVVVERIIMEKLNLQLPFRLPTVGRTIPMWVIREPGQQLQFPSPAIRVRQGQIVHTLTHEKHSPPPGTHTIHHHGIEPTPMNDGVGKHSFEISGQSHTYQWQADIPGTYIYHCHVNTPLHFEMGLYGLLIVDPPEGPGFVAAYNPPTHVMIYDVEAFWVPDDMDSRWHLLGEHAFQLGEQPGGGAPTGQQCGGDPNDPNTFLKGILNDWQPDVFAITGVVARDAATPITDPRVAVTARVGQTILVRLVNASYAINEYTLGIDALVIAADGRALGVPPYGSYSQPFTVPAGTPFRLTTARRWDLILRPNATGVYPFKVDFIDWVTGKVRGTARTRITVS